jgi:uncharacterized YigZ family protein
MNDPPDSYDTLAAAATAAIKIQRSRFLAEAAPAEDRDAAVAVVDTVARRYHDCRHVCYAWRLGRGEPIRELANDAGEPSGSAGQPILGAIRQERLSDCVVVVARYFGGIKLGTGGLARAYGAAAGAALAQAPRRTVPLGRRFDLTFAYRQQAVVARLLELHRGRVEKETYQADIAWQVWLPHSQWRRFGIALREATAGALNLDPEA